MPDNEVKFSGGGTGSKQPRLELIPYIALLRAAARFELGIANRPDGSAWNALSSNFRTCLADQKFILSRASHAAQHAMKLKAILAGEIADDGDDHAGAILWAGCFLACATDPSLVAPRCSACGGDGKLHTNKKEADQSDSDCPACRGTGIKGGR